MGYTDLKASLDAVVKTNGRQEITGSNLNGVMTTLLQGVDVLDRANPADTSGMNHVVLKKNKTFAEQVTGGDTIYEIRDSFDLANGSVNIPSGSILKFNGGKIVNGTLNGDFSIEAGLVKIFSNVKFQGNCENNEVELDWFVANKMDSCILDGTQLDATTEIQDAFNSKATKIHISNKFFYYITNTISVNSWQQITGTPQTNGIQRSPTNAVPSIYTDTDCIMMIVYANSDNNTKMVRRVNIDHLYLRRYAAFTSDDFKDNIPMLKLTNSPLTQTMTYNNVWGCNLNVFLWSADRNINVDVNGVQQTAWMKGFLGLEIDVTNGGFYTYIVINGDITGFRKGLYTHVTSGWMTDIRLLCDTNCAFGGNLDGGPFRIGGSHQPVPEIVDYADAAYFTIVSGNGISDAKVWDLGGTAANGLGATTYAFNAPQGFIDLINYKQTLGGDSIPITRGNRSLPINSGVHYRFWGEMYRMIGFERNLLERRFTNVIGKKVLDNELYTIYTTQSNASGNITKIAVKDSQTNDEIALTQDNVVNYSHLFKAAGAIIGQIGSLVDTLVDESYLIPDIAQSYDRYVAVFEIERNHSLSVLKRGSYVGFLKDAAVLGKDNTITLEYLDSSNNVIKSSVVNTSENDLYYTQVVYANLFVDKTFVFSKLRITFDLQLVNNSTLNRVIPKAFITSASLSNALSQSGGEIPGKSVFGSLYGFNYETNPMRGYRCWNDPHINKEFSASTNASIYTGAICVGTSGKSAFYLKLTDERGRQSVLYVRPSTGEAFTDSPNFIFRIKTISTAGNTDNKVLIGVQTTDPSVIKYTIDYIQANTKFKFYDSTADSGYDTTNYAYPMCAATAKRPSSPAIGACFFDTTLGKPIWWNGTAWVDSTGTAV